MISLYKKIFSLFPSTQRRELFVLFVAIVITAIFEILGIASVMPFLAVVSAPENIPSTPFLSTLYNLFNIASTESFLMLLGGIVLAIIIIGNVIGALTIWLLYRFTTQCEHHLAQRLFINYLNQPYDYFLNRNSAELNKNILSEVSVVTNGVIIPGMNILARIIVVVCIAAFLFAMSPGLSLSVGLTLGSFYTVLYLLNRRKLAALGSARTQVNKYRYKQTTEAFGAIKEVKLRGKEDYFAESFSRPSNKYASYRAYELTTARIPRYILDAVAFGGILIILLYLITTRENLQQVLPVVGMFAYAGYRLMPSLQEIFHNITTLRFNAPALDSFSLELNHGDNRPEASCKHERDDIQFNKRLVLKDISYTYPNTDSSVLKNISLQITANTTVAFVGKTGCGKTTLIDIILGLLQPTSGTLLVDNVAISSTNVSQWQRHIDYVPQQIYLTDQSIAANIAFGVAPSNIDMEAVIRSATIANIHDFISNELPAGYDTVVGERGVRLSGGQQQRIGIARALYRDPKVLVLDEATSALDAATEQAIMTAINELTHKKTIIMITHRLQTVKNCDRIFVVEQGAIASQGNYSEIVQNNATLYDLSYSRN